MLTVKCIFGRLLVVPIETSEYQFAKNLDDFRCSTFIPISGCTGIGQLSGETFELSRQHAIALKKLFIHFVGIVRLFMTVEQIDAHLALIEQENAW